MSSRSGGAAPPYWTEWEFDEGRQLLRRELRDYRGKGRMRSSVSQSSLNTDAI